MAVLGGLRFLMSEVPLYALSTGIIHTVACDASLQSHRCEPQGEDHSSTPSHFQKDRHSTWSRAGILLDGLVKQKNNCFTEMCSGFEAGSYSRLIDFVYHSTLGLRVIKKRRRTSDFRDEAFPRHVNLLLAPAPCGALPSRRLQKESSLLPTYWSESTLSSL